MCKLLGLWLLTFASCYTPPFGEATRCSREGICPEGRSCVDGMCSTRLTSSVDASLPEADGPAGADADAPPSVDASVIDSISVADGAIDAGACDEGYVECDGTCYYPASDPNHCGDCTTFCPSGVCSVGRCLEYFGDRTYGTSARCTPNGIPPGELKQLIHIPYPVTLQKLGVVFRGDGSPPYTQKIYSADFANVPIATTPTFGPKGNGNFIETAITAGAVDLHEGDYLVSIIVNDGCPAATTEGVINVWAVVLR